MSDGRGGLVWSREAIVAAAHEWEAANGRPPGMRDWVKAGPAHPDASIVRHRFDSWNAMMAEAGYTPRRQGGQRIYTRAEVLRAVLVWRFERGRLPRYDDWRVPSSDRPCVWHVLSLFGGWNAMIVAAGYEPVCARRSTLSYRQQRPRTPGSRFTKAAA